MPKTGGAFTALFELYFKNDLSLPRLGALPYLACIVRLCWGKASLGVRLVAHFLLMQCVCGFAAAFGWAAAAKSRSVQIN